MRSIIARCWGIGAVILLALGSFSPQPVAAQTPCVADCDGNGTVSVDELVMEVNIGLGNVAPDTCPGADYNNDGKVTVDEVVMAVNGALDGCTAIPFGCSGSTTAFDSTFAGIQQTIFENHGCTNVACHGTHTNPQGGLDLSPDVAYQNLIQVPSTTIPGIDRVYPGDETKSMLYLKLALATDPTKIPANINVSSLGSPMPVGLTPLSADELTLMQEWIFGGAPKTGTVPGTDKLLNACLPPAQPITITPLEPPAADAGIQFVMAPWKVEAHSEHEICFATYYDITDQVPPQFKVLDPKTGLTYFLFNSQELRQDPFSHHLILNRYLGSPDDVHDPSFGTWTCKGGEKDGQVCEPTDQTFCGSGFCTSAIQQSFACIGFGPFKAGNFQNFQAIGGAQRAQFSDDYAPGVYGGIPTRGILYWNSHAFNLTNEDAMLHARLNYYYTSDIRYPVQSIFDTRFIFSANAAPYTTQKLCKDYTPLPQGARLFELSSHTHKHGKDFTVYMPDGTQIYESFVYNDPVTQKFDPPIEFDSPNAADRTLRYCSVYNNGVALDDSPDPTTVTRASHVPLSAQISGFGVCTPIACVSGKVGAACNGSGDNATCDSAPGANDGMCDACPITGGESTENEMFILIGSYYLPTSGTESTSGAVVNGPLQEAAQ